MTKVPRPVMDEAAAWEYICDGRLLSLRRMLKTHTIVGFIEPHPSANMHDLEDQTVKRLLTAMGPLSGQKRAVMFSGGFDSLLIAQLAKEAGARLTALTVQFEDFNPRTIQAAREGTKRLGLEHRILSINAADYLSGFEMMSRLCPEPWLDLDLAAVYAALKKYDRQAGPVIISGMGSDQWFGDDALKVEAGMEEHLERALADESAHQQIAATQECRFVFPFLSKDMLALSMAIPAEMKKDKRLLRSLKTAQSIVVPVSARELQVPYTVRQLVIKAFGGQAWPDAVSIESNTGRVDDQKLRRIFLGLWLKAREGGR